MSSIQSDGEHGFQIAPMLDVLFVLLLFFMVSAGAQKHERVMGVSLPGRGERPEPKIPVILEIAADGQVSFNGAPTDTPGNHQLPETMARLKAVLVDSPDRPVIIEPPPSTRHQRVIDTLNLCKAVHAQNIAFSSSFN